VPRWTSAGGQRSGPPGRDRPLGRTATLAGLELDHVLIAVADLDAAAREMDARYGLASVEGGRHEGWGTANRIVPLGDVYLELVAVVDEAEAAGSEFGRWVGRMRPTGRPIRPFAWAVRTGELDAIAGRLALTTTPGSRAGRDGRLLSWRLAGMDEAVSNPSLPFFVEWDSHAALPGRAPVSHREGRVEIAELHVTGNVNLLATWLGTDALPVTVRPGPPGVAAVVLRGAAGEIVIRC
jgi:Glyoxalase-like domain